MVFEMPIFGQSQFDKLAEKATNETNVAEDWQSILECCDYLSAQQSRPLDCLRSIMKRMSHPHPNVSIQAIILLDACVSNCGKKFHLEVASREFLAEARKLIEKGHPRVVERFKLMIKKWSENEFKSDPELSMIPSFYAQLKKEGFNFTDPTKPQLPKDPNVVISDQEEEDIIKALELSMKDIRGGGGGGGPSNNSSMYPDIDTSIPNNPVSTVPADASRETSKKVSFKVRALYDFEAAEENELTFKAGDLITVSDDRDENWWTGSNQRGEGLFPANFVTKDLDTPIEDSTTTQKSVQFNDQVRVKFLEEEVTEVDEGKIDRLLHLIHEADPTGVTPDSDELVMLEDQCGRMGVLIDKELERLDRIQVALNTANRQLTDSMKEFLYLNQ
uniref:Signal transducing adapter molecule 1 n=1 Tax=Aceria tosichella TaxID=561515 RepID=A0A6G1S9A8_9ACAR